MNNITKTEASTIRMSAKCPHCGKDIVINFYEDIKDKIKAVDLKKICRSKGVGFDEKL